MCSRAVHRGRRLSAGLSCPGRGGGSPSTPVAAAAGSSRESPGQVICEDFDLAGVGDQNREAHARERHVDRDAGTGLAADAGDGTFDGRGMCAEHTCVN